MNNRIIRQGPIEISLNYAFSPSLVRLTYPISKQFIEDSFLGIEGYQIKVNCMRGEFVRINKRWYYSFSKVVTNNFDEVNQAIQDELRRIKHTAGCHKRIGKYWDISYLMVCYHSALNPVS